MWYLLKQKRYQRIQSVAMDEIGKITVFKFKLNEYGSVLMDTQIPVMDGYMAIKAILRWEQEQKVAQTPIIALTAQAIQEDAERTRDAGCAAHVTKPIRKQTLIQTIQEHTRSA